MPITLRRLILALTLGLAGALPAAAQDVVDIRFAPGTSGATINGTIVGQEYIDYVLGARAGQRMNVDLTVTGTNGNGSANFNILPAGQDFPALYNSSNEGTSGSVLLPETRDWAIRVYLMGNDADTGKTVGYSIDVSIDGSSGQAAGGGTGLLPEEDFFVVNVSGNGTLNVRNDPRPSGTLLGRLPNGTAVANAGGCTMSDGQQWCEVRNPSNGLRGWVAARFLRLPGPGGGEDTATADDGGGAMAGSGNTGRVRGVPANDVLNVRSGPGTGNSIVGALSNGDTVRTLRCQNVGSSRWCEIEMMTDMRERGWVNARYLQ